MDRRALSEHVIGPGNEVNMDLLEQAIHPLAARARHDFLEQVGRCSRTRPVEHTPCCCNALL